MTCKQGRWASPTQFIFVSHADQRTSRKVANPWTVISYATIAAPSLSRSAISSDWTRTAILGRMIQAGTSLTTLAPGQKRAMVPSRISRYGGNTRAKLCLPANGRTSQMADYRTTKSSAVQNHGASLRKRAGGSHRPVRSGRPPNRLRDIVLAVAGDARGGSAQRAPTAPPFHDNGRAPSGVGTSNAFSVIATMV